ncbi:hypothetical protein, partial [Geobacillus thermopakistaniensis]|uniref:hypothetical protein n=1 Tax=Geobacillus thermopakistaniensis (strain MAS1) TaxID=1408282 RepID=UPI000519D2CE
PEVCPNASDPFCIKGREAFCLPSDCRTRVTLEEQIEEIIVDILNQYQQFFVQNGYILDIKLERINEVDALKGIEEHGMEKGQCFETNYYSFVCLAIKDSSGKLIGVHHQIL